MLARGVLARGARCWFACLLGASILVSTATAQILRVVTYNIDADSGGNPGEMGGVYAGPGLTTVLQAIGNEHLAGRAQPIDVLALQELNYSQTSTTLGYIVDQLNSIYGAGTYTYDTTFDPTTGDSTGNGPSGLVYNTRTVQVLGATSVGSASSSGAPRAPMRYTLAPAGYNDHSADFTLYVSHMKAGSASSGHPTNEARRNTEATTIRDDAYSLNDSLNGNTSAEVAHIIYAGDYNMDGSSETGYQTMISASLHSGLMKAHDTLAEALTPPNQPPYWDTTSTYQSLLTESATNVQYRDDVQYITGPVLSQPGIQLVPGSLTAFGNGGGIYHQSVTSGSNSAALTDLANRSAVLQALTTATDHLPVVADYSFASAVGAPGDYDHSGVVDSADYNLWRNTYGSSTNLLADGNHNGIVDSADYLIWRRAQASGSGAGSVLAASQVPEPAAWMLLMCGCLAYLGRSRLRG